MPVLVEAISVLVRTSAIADKFAGGMSGFMRHVPNATFCRDEDLVRIGFMDPTTCKRFIDELEANGLTYLDMGKPVDIIVCDQLRGPMVECEWVELAKFPIDDENKILAAWLFEGPRLADGIHMRSDSMALHVPDGWEFEGSISQEGNLVEPQDVARDLEFLRVEGDLEVYWDKHRSREVFLARDGKDRPLAPRKRLS